MKLGQGLVTMNHLLPREYVLALRALQDQALARDEKEVSGFERGWVYFEVKNNKSSL